MANHSNYMLSGLERELELYMGTEYESPTPGGSTKEYKWKDSKEIERLTKLEINADRTGKIVVPSYYDENENLVPATTNEFKNVEKSSDGTRIYGNPKGLAKQLLTVRITIVSSGDNSQVQVDKKAPGGNWQQHQPPTPIEVSAANTLINWVKTLSVPSRNSDLEMELDYEYEASGPTNVYEKIMAKVDYINDSRLTRKPVQNTPVEITFDFDLRRKMLTISARQMDIHYIYDTVDIDLLKSDATGRRIEGWSRRTSPHRYMTLGIVDFYKPGYLVIQGFLSSTPTGQYESKLKHDRYILEDEKEVQKLKNIFLQLLKAGHIAPLNQELEFEFGDEEYEFDDIEESDEFEYEFEFEYGDEPDDEFEYEYELENEFENNGVTENFARRLYELSNQSFESEYELDVELDRALDAMENEFMVKRLHRKRKRGKRKGLFKKILSTGAKIAGKVAGKTPIGSLIKAGTSLVRGNVKGALGNLAKAAVGTALGPVAGTVATTAIDALGGGEEGGEEGEIGRGRRKRKAIRRVARIARDTYREVADTLPEDFDHPLVANEVARKAVRKAMIKNGVKPPGRTGPQQRRVIKIRPGEKVVIVST